MLGNVDFSNLTGGAVINVNSRLGANGWSLRPGQSFLTANDDELNISSDGLLNTPAGSSTIDFLGGEDAFSNAGIVLIGGITESGGAAELSITNLSDGEGAGFYNSGVIVLGFRVVPGQQASAKTVLDIHDSRSDAEVNDRFVLRDSRFVGADGSRIYLDAALGGAIQSSCATLSVADCVDLQGTTVEGRTLIRIRDASPSFDGFRNDGIVLIDVSGGSSSEERFELDPGSLRYDEETTLGPVIRKGLIVYDLIYDGDAEQHILVGVLAPEAYQFQFLPSLALNAWRTTTGTWFDRQADLRDTLSGLGLSRGMWIRGAGDFTTRDASAGFLVRGRTLAFDTSHEQKTGALVVGGDLVSAESEDRGYVLGAMLGFSNSVTEFDASSTKLEFTGPTGGLYASFVSGGLFVDALVNASLVNMNQDAPGLNLGEGVRLKQDITIVGGQVEGGWRIPLSEAMFVEPLASFSYVRTEFEDIDAAAANSLVDFEDETVSSRGALGLRVGLDSAWRSATVRYTVTGRAWNEFEGENALVLDLPGESLPMMDDLSGTFGEVGAGISLFDDTGLVSGFLNGNMKFRDDYRSAGFSAGVRLRW